MQQELGSAKLQQLVLDCPRTFLFPSTLWSRPLLCHFLLLYDQMVSQFKELSQQERKKSNYFAWLRSLDLLINCSSERECQCKGRGTIAWPRAGRRAGSHRPSFRCCYGTVQSIVTF